MRIKQFAALLSVCFACIFLSCKKDMTNDNPGNPDDGFHIPANSPVNGRISGIVVDEHNVPVAGASAQYGASTVLTDANGYFHFENAVLDKYVTTVSINKTGYFKALRSFSATASRNYLSVKLIPKTLTASINSGPGGIVNLSNGTTVNFPANAIAIKASGAAYTGTVNVYAAYIDPTATDFAAIVPGSMMGQDPEHMYVLQSTGMVAVELESDNGQALQLASGKTAHILLPIPSSLTAKAPTTIDTWSLDDRGVWIKEGTATKNANAYEFEVSHFSFWNTDVPANAVYLTIHAQDQAGNTLPNMLVQLTVPNNTTWWATTYGTTDSTGTVAGLVPADLPIAMSVVANPYYCPAPFATQSIGPFSNDSTLNITVTLAPSQQINITGTVTDCNGQPLANGSASIFLAPFSVYNVPVTNGSYSLTAAYCAGQGSVSVTAYDGGAFTSSGNVQVTGNTVSIPSIQVCGLTQEATYSAEGLWNFGSYIVGEPVNASHYMLAVLYVSVVGTYDISLQGNGLGFSGTGYLPRIGLDTIYLTGTGTPLMAGFTPIVLYGNTGPGVSINVFAYNNTGTQAAYTLGGPGYCSNEFVEGLYITGTPVDLSNTVTMLVNVSTAGLYSISTDSVNGVRFTASGIFNSIGYNNVVMNSHGTPQSTGVSNYTVTGASDACSFNVNNFSPGSMATYDLSSDCNSNYVVHGQFLNGVPLTDQEYVTIQLNVITPGAYYISTDRYNGVAFGASGIFTNTGSQTVQLAGNGVPAGTGSNSFPIFMLGEPVQNCSFTVIYN